MCPLELFDTIYLASRDDDCIRFACEGGGEAAGTPRGWLDDVPRGADNLVVRAVAKLKERAGVRQGASIRLIKRIPTAAGLGGGSSDAAAALAAANLAWDLRWPTKELADLGGELGSDVPFFFARGPAMCRGRGEIVEPVTGPYPMHVVIARPSEGLSTASVYGACRPAESPKSAAPIIEAFKRGDWNGVAKRIWNGLEAAAQSLSPCIARMQQEFAKTDCLGFGMSGSGTSFFGVCRDARHARRVARRLWVGGLENTYAVRSWRGRTS